MSQIQLNAQNGAAFQARVANYGADKFENFLEEVSIRPNTEDGVADFRVRVDGLGATPETEALGLLDAKSSETAPLTARQAEGYPLIQQYGGTIVGNNGLPHYPAGNKNSSNRGANYYTIRSS
ncbi:MAG: hypothetical protein WDN69_09975 [Aliidongia sp.]